MSPYKQNINTFRKQNCLSLSLISRVVSEWTLEHSLYVYNNYEGIINASLSQQRQAQLFNKMFWVQSSAYKGDFPPEMLRYVAVNTFGLEMDVS